MKITHLGVSPKRIKMKLDGFPGTWTLAYKDLWDVQLALDHTLEQLGFVAVKMGGTPALVPSFRDRLQVTSFFTCDQATFEAERAERTEDGQFVCGGLWYAEITVNGISTDCSFNTLEEFYRIVDQIIIRECGLIVGKPATVPGLIGHG